MFLRKCFCTKGKIIDLKIVKGIYDTIESYMIIKIEYKDNHSITYTKNFEVGILDVKIGDYLDIYYEIENPNNYKVNIEEYGGFFSSIIFGIILLLVGVLSLCLPLSIE
jgi:hypothetical protein